MVAALDQDPRVGHDAPTSGRRGPDRRDADAPTCTGRGVALATVGSADAGTAKGGRLPILQGILPFDRATLTPNIVAGVTLAALGIPEVMGYAKIAGMPVITGLYTILIPIAVFAILGSSRHLVVGADSATAAIMAAGLAGLAAAGSADYVALAGIMAILAAGFLLLARIIRLGFLADFLSRSVLIGFLTGVGIQVAMGQLPGILGVPGGTGGTLSKFWGTLEQIPDTSLTTLAVSLSILAVILGLKAISPKIPGALIAVIGAIVASYALDLSTHGVAVLGKVPGGLPTFGIPSSGWDQWADLLPTAASIFIVILAQSAATSRAYAAKYDERFDENVDLVGLSLANVSAGLSGTFVVNGSPTKTQMVDGAGGRSQVASLSTAVIILIVLLFLTKPLQYMPEAVLSTIVFLIGIELIDHIGMRKILRWRVDEFVVAVITAAVVVIVGVEQGIILAMVLSVIDHLRRSYHPRDTILVATPSGGIRSVPVPDVAEGKVETGLVVYRFAASLYYANANQFSEEIRSILERPERAPSWLCIDAAAIGDVDYSAGETLISAHGQMQEHGTRMVFADVDEAVRAELDRYGITELVGADAFFDTVMDAVAAYRTASPPGPDDRS
jgi:high affinity sulfate transporter 1